MAADSMEIDDSLYSRQRYVLGDSAMHQMAKSSVFLSGMGGLGIEIAKNIVLAGVKAVTLHDTKQCETWDLGSNFFIRTEDVLSQRRRVEAVCPRVAELNPYVHVDMSSSALDNNTDLSFLRKYQCVILTEARLNLQKRVNEFCHSQQPPIRFIGCDAYGICVRVFCDFGEEFEVSDPTGEEPKEIFVQTITQDNPGVVTCMDNQPHGLQTGQSVVFREVNGMVELNSTVRQVSVLSPHSFAIGDTSQLQPYAHGGFFVLVKTPKTYRFETIGRQLCDPQVLTPDYSKPEAPLQIHAAMLALDDFQEQHSRLPNIGCLQDAEVLLQLTEEVNATLRNKASVNTELVRCLSRTARGTLPPLAAAVGGLASQEVLKALTGKFAPLQQWFYLDAIEIVRPLQSVSAEEFSPRGDRYDGLRACIGESMCLKLHKLRVFMVGCGAIGCEMLKNFALLGVGLAKSSGEVCITDPDLIEKSNLNRQFLFRPHHIQKPKSTTAAEATHDINPDLQVDAHLNKVCPATESIYNDSFYSRLNLVVTALDNVEARRYVDSRCVSNQKPLLDSGTMGTKGHTEIIVPNLTESYNSHRDPPEEEIPFCTLKSFPSVIEHTIQWARDKFENAFVHKPSMYNSFWQTHSSAEVVLQRMQVGESLEGSFQVIKLLSRRPSQWEQCIAIARLKFEKYFKRKALQLLHSFPLDTRLKDGSLFWQSPKRPPAPFDFDLKDPLHFTFIVSTARLFAGIYNIPYSDEDLSEEAVTRILSDVKIPEYRPAEKCIVTDETAKKPDQIKMPLSSEEEREAITQLEQAIATDSVTAERLQMNPLQFEKDDDSNGHIDFIASASALRARMYSIEPADRLKTKRIAGKIIPAIATATAAVAGLVALELIKVVGVYEFESFKNCFFNLAIPVVVLTEPAPVKRTLIRDNIYFSIWDCWTIFGHEDFTLSDFMNAVREKYGIEPTMVVHGVKMLYVPVMPGHSKRLKLTMQKLIKPSAGRRYVDLTVSFAPEADGDDDLPGPPVRYYFSRNGETP
ncbi:ubiquitin-like modifier-activating enzyme 6 [Micropterus salmoides]|uniref:ubiquitin-like modifier-activating enzyme 6 n=1 Tax=Micropterus salmoides TaxID=27706 RepID=UPI0018EAF7FA|nr:ubiquitin-like modifier-activating enzyme 6 [Micropterus salmoides]XP_038569436.1 ubiquitin-like modifier-activating enzyme 6 [Micropterus salmoides]XP_038569437.1 ubiquitin-like modifier-activating enzyme 6 [Micropterus salmoides]XP_038569438.1 ubiquitin-like modifier-activating enzyme 6 [Micropterus salmoides]